MQVILLEDVKSLGKKGEVVKVSDGYAKNMLLPKKLGVEATQNTMTLTEVLPEAMPSQITPTRSGTISKMWQRTKGNILDFLTRR